MDEFVESCLQQTIDSDAETVVSSRGGSKEGSQVSLSGVNMTHILTKIENPNI